MVGQQQPVATSDKEPFAWIGTGVLIIGTMVILLVGSPYYILRACGVIKEPPEPQS